ncbi:MAG TPA: phenylalanine--tRNA ligase subunit alpha [Candidatus Saccharimonadales bacterium]|nr:phenylalanine--tRNA ligase subunit alpha [Candidatus Saccharimonadales bacterium]
MAINLNEIVERITSTTDEAELEKLRTSYLGRNGTVTHQLRAVGELPAAERAAAGTAANQLRLELEQAFDKQKAKLRQTQLEQAVSEITLDVTAPVDAPNAYGHAHPVLSLIDDLVRIYWQMGFTVIDGPEIETEWYNFEALNIPEGHPARDMQDTFYLEGGNLPRTHTSNLQIRYMEENQPPIRIVAPGKVYRNEDEDSRHVWMFHQIEGLVVDRGISMADLKGTLYAMMRGLLGETTEIKLLPNYFPYTEPSVELHATCPSCKGKGCKMCSDTGWLELGGAGMVHPQVLRNVGIDPAVYNGFAFGFGPERIAAIKYDIPDIRGFWRPNLRFLEQF